MEKTIETLASLAGSTTNDVIKFFIVLFIGVPSIVLYLNAKSREKTARHKESMEREKEARKQTGLMLDVVSKNTEVNTRLITMLESTNQNCAGCRTDQTNLYRELNDKQDNMLLLMTQLIENIKSLKPEI